MDIKKETKIKLSDNDFSKKIFKISIICIATYVILNFGIMDKTRLLYIFISLITIYIIMDILFPITYI